MKSSKLKHGTWHILKQVEWYNKLRKKYRCSLVEMEYKEKIKGDSFNKSWKPIFIVYDVYGKTSDGRIFIVEVGNIPDWKLCFLQRLARRGVTFIHIPKPHGKNGRPYGHSRKQFIRLDTLFPFKPIHHYCCVYDKALEAMGVKLID
jgi:hypothetical protein